MSAILYLSNNGAQTWLRQGRLWQPVASLPAGTPLAVICDLPEESLGDLDLPRLGGRDRADFLARQLSARFPDTRYRTIVPLRGEKLLARGRALLIGVAAQARLDDTLVPLAASGQKISGLWPITALISALAQSPRLPATLFVALPGVAGLRIVFLKNRTPLLSRLAPATDTADAIVEELSRTRRYLENSRAIERGEVHYPLLYLGDSRDILDGIARLRLDALALPDALAARSRLAGDAHPPQLALFFEKAGSAPPGQIAPLALRRHFLADRVKKIAWASAAVLLGLGTYAASDNLSSIRRVLGNTAEAQQQAAAASEETARLEAAIATHGVAANTLRQAIALEARELNLLPDLRARLAALSGAIGESSGWRLSELSWALKNESLACPEQGAPPSETATAPSPRRVVEIEFAARLPESSGPRAQAQARQLLSARLQQLPGVTVRQDPNRQLKTSLLSGSAAKETASHGDEGLRWCLTLRTASTGTGTE